MTAGEHRRTKAASLQEMNYGDGAAAILVGEGKPIARLLAAHSETVDFVDHFRGADAEHDYAWEERWIRDEGYLKIVPRAIEAALKKAGAAGDAVTHFCMPCTLPRVGSAVAKRCGIPEGAVRDTLAAVCGDTGAAHPLLMLAHALEDAKAGDRAARRKRGRKNIAEGVVHIHSTFNNTIVTITDYQGNVISWSSAGAMGFKGSRKGTPFAAQQAADSAAKKAMDHGLRSVQIFVRGPGAGRESALRALQSAGINISLMKDVTPIPHNGCRPPKRRRV